MGAVPGGIGCLRIRVAGWCGGGQTPTVRAGMRVSGIECNSTAREGQEAGDDNYSIDSIRMGHEQCLFLCIARNERLFHCPLTPFLSTVSHHDGCRWYQR